MKKTIEDDIFDTLTIAIAKRKLRMADLIYELTRLQFAATADAVLNYPDKKSRNTFDVKAAAEIILKYVPACLAKSKYILNYTELDALYGFCIMCLVDEINPMFFIKTEQSEA